VSAAFLIAINPYQIWHSQDVRNYTLWPALSLLALIFFWQWRNAVSESVGVVAHTPTDHGTILDPKIKDRRTRAGSHTHIRFLFLFVLAELAALYTQLLRSLHPARADLYMLVFFLRRLPPRSTRSSWLSAVGQWVTAQLALALLYLPFPADSFEPGGLVRRG